ncbi:hypothetical protein [Sinorhizobium fredii]|uniref:hypothetical protein n=1 Tax=Rhizobium fredii TaxID=380 RepID=UPI00117D9BDE|nr:hypothetical protein [Sinorhizobium fredii]
MAESEFEVPANRSVRVTWHRPKDEACRLKLWYRPAGSQTWLFIIEAYAERHITTIDSRTHSGLGAKNQPWRIKCESLLKIGGAFDETYPDVRPEANKTTILIYAHANDPEANTVVTFNYV